MPAELRDKNGKVVCNARVKGHVCLEPINHLGTKHKCLCLDEWEWDAQP